MTKHTRAYWSKRITVGNVKHGDEGVYIGRPMPRYPAGSSLGNPFKLKSEAERPVVIGNYGVWLDMKLADAYSMQSLELARLVNILLTQGHLELLCWCKEPGREVACHGDIIKERILDRVCKAK